MRRPTLAAFGPSRGGVRVLVDKRSDRIVVQWSEHSRRRVKWWPDTKEARGEAVAWAETFHRTRTEGPKPQGLSVRAIWERYVASPAYTNLRLRTQQLYTEHWKRWELFIGREFIAEHTRVEQVDAFRGVLTKIGLAPGHQQRIVRDVKTVYTWAESREILSRNRLASYRFTIAKDARRPKPAAYTREEAERLIATLHPQKATEWRPWCALVLAAYQGRRERAILHLKREDVDWEKGRIRWVAEYDKNGEESWQPLTLAGYCAVLTARWWASRDGKAVPWLFYSPWGHKTAGREEPGVYGAQALILALRKAEERAQITHKRGRAVHSLRRGVGKEIAAMTGDPMRGLDWLGDKSPAQIVNYVQQQVGEPEHSAHLLDQPWTEHSNGNDKRVTTRSARSDPKRERATLRGHSRRLGDL